MSNFTRKFVNDAGVELEVDGSFRIVEDDPSTNAQEIEIESVMAWRVEHSNDPDAPTVTLSDDEHARLYEELCADPNTWEYDND